MALHLRRYKAINVTCLINLNVMLMLDESCKFSYRGGCVEREEGAFKTPRLFLLPTINF